MSIARMRRDCRLTVLSTLAAVLLLWYAPAATGQSLNATGVLDDAEQVVNELAEFVLKNYNDTEALAKSCDDVSDCSRRVCAPSRDELKEFPLSCETVPTNPDCNAEDNSSCTSVLISRERSYIWWSRDAALTSPDETPTCEMKSTVCSQRLLDTQIFKPKGQISALQVSGYLFFGSSNGLLRIYPGKEMSRDLCDDYELRERPWFVGAMGVKKELVVLLDAGPQMGQGLSLDNGQRTFFDAARNTSLRLLDTLTRGDSMSVLTFDGSGASVVEPKVNVNVTVSADDQPSLLELKNQIKKIPTPDTSFGRSANFTAALVAGRDRFSSQTSRMKVFIIITLGYLFGPSDLEDDLLNSLEASNVTIFMYRLLERNTSGDSISMALQNASCSLNGWYEEDVFKSQDPLGTLASYYSFVARLRFNVSRGQPYWVSRYSSYTGIGDIITVARPVFNGSFMVGVVGKNIGVDSLGAISQDVTTELNRRNKISFIDIPNPPRVTCGETLSQSAKGACTNATGLCSKDLLENTQETLQARVCCGNCPDSGSNGIDGGKLAGAIVGGVLGGILLLICVALCGIRCTRSTGRWPKKTVADPPWSSNTEEMVL